SPLLVTTLLPYTTLFRSAQDSGFAVAQHIPVVQAEIVEDQRHLLGLFGSQAEVLLPSLKPDVFAALGVERKLAMHRLMGPQVHRSEEHTSELQSRVDLVC